MPFHTSLTKTVSDFIGSLSKSMYGESLSAPEGLPSLGDGLGSKLKTWFAPPSIQYQERMCAIGIGVA